jgi:hypothetical protein
VKPYDLNRIGLWETVALHCSKFHRVTWMLHRFFFDARPEPSGGKRWPRTQRRIGMLFVKSSNRSWGASSSIELILHNFSLTSRTKERTLRPHADRAVAKSHIETRTGDIPGSHSEAADEHRVRAENTPSLAGRCMYAPRACQRGAGFSTPASVERHADDREGREAAVSSPGAWSAPST